MKNREIKIEYGDETITHVMEEEQDLAIRAAMAANRPLLVRGEPGIGKTQLAYAAAIMLKRPLVAFTVDSATESRDLMWSFDAVERLAEAQAAAHLYADKDELRAQMDVKRFVRPGPIWWAIDWASAQKQLAAEQAAPERPKGWKADQGVVILIDEIDKADSDVPNGLLEAFGLRQFTPQGWSKPIKMKSGVQRPLIIVTTNEERMLPDAFMRRCFVLNLRLPDCVNASGEKLSDEQHNAFLDFLIGRGEAHFQDALRYTASPQSRRVVARRSPASDSRESIAASGPSRVPRLIALARESLGRTDQRRCCYG